MIRKRGPGCPSDLRLDQWLAGELTQAEQDALEAHTARCQPCRRRVAELSEEQRSFVGSAPPLVALAPVQPKPCWSWRAPAAALLAAAALVLLIGRPGQQGLEPDGAGARTKGSLARLSWVVRRGERVVSGRPDQALRAGDALRFSVSAHEPVYAALLGRDPVGRVSVYYPEAAELELVAAGNDQPLPVAIELDATPGDEQVHAVFCRDAVSVVSVREAIERSPYVPALPSGCSHELATLHKERL